jgi:anti-sigma B factor antagonist
MKPLTSLDIQVQSTPEATVVTLRGELDLASAPRVDAALDVLEAGDVVLDLRSLTYLDSTGVYLLLRRDREARALGRRFTLRPGPPPVQRLFSLTRTDQRLRFAA